MSAVGWVVGAVGWWAGGLGWVGGVGWEGGLCVGHRQAGQQAGRLAGQAH